MLVSLAAASVVGFVGSLIAIPWILVRLPANYFDIRVERPPLLHGRHPLLRSAAHVAKNLLGLVLLLAGIAMLVLPGQGVLTILIGLSLIDFPGKRTLEARIIGRPIVLNGINALRARFHKEPFVIAGSAPHAL